MLLIRPLSHFSSFSLHWEWSLYLLTRNIWKLISKMSIGKFQLNRMSCNRVQNLLPRKQVLWFGQSVNSVFKILSTCCEHRVLSKRFHEKLQGDLNLPAYNDPVQSSPVHTWSCSAKTACLKTTQSGLRYGATLTNCAASGCDQLWPWGLFRFVCISDPTAKFAFYLWNSGSCCDPSEFCLSRLFERLVTAAA